jgi:hypothetical protein
MNFVPTERQKLHGLWGEIVEIIPKIEAEELSRVIGTVVIDEIQVIITKIAIIASFSE